MPKVNTYTAGRLASEQTGIPRPDQSAEIIGDAGARLAGQTANVINDALTKQRALLQKAELTKQISQFDSDMAMETAEIRQQNVSTPDEGVKQLQTRRQELFSQYKDGIKDQDVKLAFDAFGAESMIVANAHDQMWAFQENNKIIQKTHFDRMTSDAEFAGQTDNFNDVLQKAQLLDANREDFYQAWGGVLEGSKVIDSGQESMVKAYLYAQLSKGNAFKVLKEIDDGRLGSMEGSNGLIEAKELRTIRNYAYKMAMAGKEDGAALALIGAVQSNFDIDAALDAPISVTEEKINSLSFEIARKKDLVAKGEVAPEEVATLEKYQGILEHVRAAQISRSDMYVVPDPEVTADLNSRFLSLFSKGNMKKPFKAKLDEVFKFQEDLVKNRDKIEPALFKKYSLLVDRSFQAEIQGFVKGSKLKARSSWFGLGPQEPVDPGQLSSSKKMQGVFSNVIALHDPKTQTNQELFETMKIFFDDLDERLNLKNTQDLNAIPQADLDLLMSGAKKKMQLKKMGLPIYLGEKNVIYRGGLGYTITGFDSDGMPLVEPAK